MRGGVRPFGAGIYRYDSLFSGAGNRGTDIVTLVIALPLLALSVLGYRRGSLRWQLVLTGALAYFLYVSASVAVGAAFNPAFLVYVSRSARACGGSCCPSAVSIGADSRSVAWVAAAGPGGVDDRQRCRHRRDLGGPGVVAQFAGPRRGWTATPPW